MLVVVFIQEVLDRMKPLIDVIFRSEKRKNTLLLLKDNPGKMDFLLKELDSTRQALLPQIRILEDHFLVTGYNDVYELTTIGKLIADEVQPLLGTMDVLNEDIEYWGTHKLDFIPEHLRLNIRDLQGFRTIKPSLTEMFELNREYYDYAKKSGSLYKLTTYFHPDFPAFFEELTDNNVRINFIITEDLLDKLRSERYGDYAKSMGNELINLFVYPKKTDLLTYTFNDHCILMRLLKDNGESDVNHIICNNPSAVEWGRKMFEHFLQDSIPVTGM
ncbi:MAG: hypothetical protein AWU59_2429 [Methanolobus sp. T82-4]|nr:MAG: hypothetical protein AWU59_2429 [Methanolobus sp. T82-4]